MNAIAAYKQQSVATQSRGRLIVMLYDGAIKFLRQAMETDDAAEKGRCVGKAMDILIELNSALDMEAGGEVALNLRQLYDFMQRHLLQAHAENDWQMFREVIALLEELNESWRVITA